MNRFLMRNKNILIGVLVVLSVVLFVLLQSDEIKSVIPRVTVSKVSKGSLDGETTLTGVLAPSLEVDISAKTNGQVVSMMYDVGDRVSSGAVLARLDGNVERATVTGLGETLFKIQQTISDVEGLYGERIKSSEEGLALVKQSGSVGVGSTKSVSLLTSLAITTSQVNDTLSEILGIRDGVKNYKSIPYYNALGATNASAKSKAEESLIRYQKLQSAYQSFFNENILSKTPTEETVAKGLALAGELADSGKSALADSYTMLLYTLQADQLTESQINTFKASITTLGSQVEAASLSVRGAKSEVLQSEIGLATLKKERDSKISEINAQASQIDGQIKVSEAMLGNASLAAPFDGVITAKLLEVGSVAAFGSPVYHLVSDSKMKMVVSVSDDMVTSFKLGQEGFVIAGDKKIAAKISKIYPAATIKTNKVSIEFEIDNTERTLIPGSLARAVLSTSPAPVTSITVPRSALISRYGLTYVFVVENGKAVKKIVKVGNQDDASVEILSGLLDTDQVVNEGALYLRSGDSVEIVNDSHHE